MPPIDLRLLETFVRVVDAGSFTKAAAGLRQPKSRISRRIAALEQTLRTPLLYRTTRQFGLTTAGRDLYERVRPHIYRLDDVTTLAGAEPGALSGVLKITASEDLGALLMGPLLDEFHQLHQHVRVELNLSNQVVDLVRESMDVALRVGKLQDSALMARSLGKVAFVLVASPAYLSGHAPIRRLRDLELHATLVFAAGSAPAIPALRAQGKPTVRTEFKAKVTCNHPQVIAHLAMAGHGVALIPEFFCIEALREGRLQRVLPTYASPAVPVQLVWPQHKQHHPQVRAFVELAAARLTPYFRRSASD